MKPWSPRLGLPAAAVVVAAAVLIAVPVLLVATNVRWAFSEPRLYTYGFDKYRIAEVTGIPDPELRRIAGELIDYFNNDADLLDMTVSGAPLFNEREVIHMRDVKGLVRGVYRVQAVAGLALGASVVAGFWLWRGAFVRPLLRRMRTAGLVTLGVLGVSGIAVGVAFPWIFTLFHKLSFSNSFWQLDPRVDNLVRLFPQGFWFDATMALAVATAIEAALLTVGSWLVLRSLRQRDRARSPAGESVGGAPRGGR